MQRPPRFDPVISCRPRSALSGPFADTRAMAGVEYALLAALIATLVLGATGLLGGRVLALYHRVLAVCPAAHAAPQLPQAIQRPSAAAK